MQEDVAAPARADWMDVQRRFEELHLRSGHSRLGRKEVMGISILPAPPSSGTAWREEGEVIDQLAL
jgi:hypothetical protein